jgi:hypothetical protein
MKVDVPTPAGYQTPTSAIDFLTFNDVIVDGSEHTATMDPATGTVTNRVYVEVHNRGIVEAASVQVMLLLTNASAGLAPLPAGYEANVQAGTAIASGGWQTVGVRTVTNLRVGFPQVAAFNLPSTMLPPPASLPGQAHHCLLAIVHSAQDVYTTTQMLVDPLAIAERKVGQRNLHVVAFVGTPPPPGAGIWSRLELHGRKGDDSLRELVLDTRGYKGRLGVLLPDDLRVREVVGLRESREEYVPAWAKDHSARLNELIAKGRFNVRACREMQLDIRRVADRPLLLGTVKKAEELALKGFALESGKRYPVFLYFEPEQLKIGQSQAVHVILRDPKTKRVEGGSTYHLVVTPKGKA